MKCNCYVRILAPIDIFTLRYGAHGLNCPVYRESGDPVDKLKDVDARDYFTVKVSENLIDNPEINNILQPPKR